MDSKKLKLLGQPFGQKFGQPFGKKFGQAVGMSVLIVAASAGSLAEVVEPTVYQLGDGGAISPHVALEIGHDNNPLRADAGSSETFFLRLQPSADYILARRNNRLTFSYAGDFYQYVENYCQGQTGVVRPGDCLQGSPDFDKASFLDHRLSLTGFLEVSKRLRATLNLNQIIQHQPLGTGLSTNRQVLDDLTSPDDWNFKTARAELSYGARQARGEVRAGLFLADRELNTERDTNLDAQSDNSVAPYLQLLYRVGTRTQLFTGFGYDRVRDSISFNPNGTVIENQERDITRLGFGVELDSRSVTSGSISLSYVEEDFLADNRTDLTYLAWDVSLIWRPRTFSTVTFSGGRETESGIFQENISLTSTIGAEWEHFWRDRFSTRLDVQHERNENVDESTGNEGSDDRTTLFRFEGSYNVRRWLDIGGFVGIENREGDFEFRDYERTLIGVSANGTI